MTSTVNIPSGIRGVSEERRTPRLGKIRLGKQVANKNGCRDHKVAQQGCPFCFHPVMSPHFVFDAGTPVGDTLYEMFGAECAEIPVAFPSDDPSEFAPRNLEMWGAGTMKCRGNGESALALVQPVEFKKYTSRVEASGGQRLQPPTEVWASTSRAGNASREAVEPVREVIPCFGLGYDGEPPCVKYGEGKDCKPTMRLHVIVRGFPGLGTFEVDTGSLGNINEVDNFLAYLGQYTGGRFAMIPLFMRLVPRKVRGRDGYGLQFGVDFAAMAADGIGALPGVGAMAITDRIVAFLPEATARPVPSDMVPGPVGEEPPSDSDVIEGSFVEQDEEPSDGTPEEPAATSSDPIGEAAMNAAAEWLNDTAKAAKCTVEDVLEALNTDIVGVAANLPAVQAQWARMRPAGTAPAAAAEPTGNEKLDAITNPGQFFSYFWQEHRVSKRALIERCSLQQEQDFEDLATQEGGWNAAAKFVEETFLAPAGAAS